MTPQEKEELIDNIFVNTVGVAAGVVSLIGLTGNILSLVVLTRPEMRANNSNMYLIILSVYDITYLLLSFFLTSLDWFFYGQDPYHLYTLEFTVPAAVVVDPLINVAVMGSVYTTVAMTIDRCIAVVKPLQWASLCTRFRIRIILVIIFLWSAFISAPLFAEVTWKKTYISYYKRYFQTTMETEYGKSTFHTDVYLKVLHPIATMLIPVVTIFICNIIIIVKVVFKRKDIASSQSASARASHGTRLTAQVLFISVLTLISRVLEASSVIVMTTENTTYVNLCTVACASLSAAASLAVRFNSAVNFICYCYFGRKFRKVFFATFPCLSCSCRKRGSRGISGADTSTRTPSQDGQSKTNMTSVMSVAVTGSPYVVSTQEGS